MSLPTGQWNIYQAQHQSVLLEARQAYLGQEEDRSVLRADKLEEFIHFMKSEITKVLVANDVQQCVQAMFAARHDLTSALGVQGGKVHTRYFIFFLLSIFFIPEIFAQDKILIGLNGRNSLINMKRQERF